MTRVKICGISTEAAMDAVAEAGADWVGFVFYAPSPRSVTPTRAAALASRGGPPSVGLFVDPADDEVVAALDRLPLHALQIYATAERAAALRLRFRVPVWHAVGVSSAADLPGEVAGVDRLLLDAKPPPGAVLPGGNAQRFDWAVLRGWSAPLPWLLAGGLTPGNVAEAVRVSGAPAVDVSSGVERDRNQKDPALIRAFIAAVRE